MSEILTVGELRKALEGVPDNMPVRFVQDGDNPYGACCDAEQNAFIEFKDGSNDYEFFENDYEEDSISESEIENRVPCFIISICHQDWWDFEDDEYYIKDGVKNPKL